MSRDICGSWTSTCKSKEEEELELMREREREAAALRRVEAGEAGGSAVIGETDVQLELSAGVHDGVGIGGEASGAGETELGIPTQLPPATANVAEAELPVGTAVEDSPTQETPTQEASEEAPSEETSAQDSSATKGVTESG
mmetsp:Transcript_13480/g.31910  ORF Transcript_13480/g.31910 Transcript_13480/m.31910 type:complete len:141 (-) Transcript_13480:20-442(-)